MLVNTFKNTTDLKGNKAILDQIPSEVTLEIQITRLKLSYFECVLRIAGVLEKVM